MFSAHPPGGIGRSLVDAVTSDVERCARRFGCTMGVGTQVGSRKKERITRKVDLASFARDSERKPEVAPRSDVRQHLALELVPWLKVTLEQLRELPIDPRAAFLVSLVDGQCSVETIADVAGMPAFEAAEIFAMLAQLGAIELRKAR
jgi:hypothetical protein